MDISGWPGYQTP